MCALRRRCAEYGFLDSYSATGSEISIPAVGVTPDLTKLMHCYSKSTPVLFNEKLEVGVITLLATPVSALFQG